jgi:hypothetical protein
MLVVEVVLVLIMGLTQLFVLDEMAHIFNGGLWLVAMGKPAEENGDEDQEGEEDDEEGDG